MDNDSRNPFSGILGIIQSRGGIGLFLYLLLCSFTIAFEPAKAQDNNKRICKSMDRYQFLIDTDTEFRENQEKLEQFTADLSNKYPTLGMRSSVITLPTVVHVLWNRDSENISNEQINSAFAAVNADLRGLNPDLSVAPDMFEAISADTRIQLSLAKRDPDCNPTTGINRVNTSVTGWSFDNTNDPIKSTSSGGADPWPSDQYLNVWVVNYSDDTLGYSTFPSDPLEEQGIVINYTSFGTVGEIDEPFHLNRTFTHELGHFLNLFHIWGDDTHLADSCSESDLVDDTPNQDGPNSGCPVFPKTSCDNSPNGDMFVNFMDYSDDACLLMFTQGQSNRATAALFGSYTDLLGSNSGSPPVGGADLWAQDSENDDGTEPNANTSKFYRSSDIWVRNQNDGFSQQDHQNPIFSSSGQTNFVYTRVRNRGCEAGAEGTNHLYWAKASTGLDWPSKWDGSETSPALLGNEIGSKPTGVVQENGSTVLEYEWLPPNPDDYSSFGADKSHFCLLSRIETEDTAPFGMAQPETSNLTENARNNNNIVWKNVTIATDEAGGRKTSSVSVASVKVEGEKTRLYFDYKNRDMEKSALDWGEVIVDLGATIYTSWNNNNRSEAGIEYLGGNMIEVLKQGGWIEIESMEEGKISTIDVIFEPNRHAPMGIYRLSVDQVAVNAGNETNIGGQIFLMKVVDNDHSTDKSVTDLLYRTWIRSLEEDTDEHAVYRPKEFKLPPSRGREGFTIMRDGSIKILKIGKGDGILESDGSWEILKDNGNTLRIAGSGESKQKTQFVEIVAISGDTLILKKKRR